MELAPAELKKPVSGDLLKFEHALKETKIFSADLEDIKKALRLIMIKVGLREQNWPANEEKAVLIHHILNEYRGHTVTEIVLAFDMAFARKLDLSERDIPCYENFSCEYFSKIMNAYRKWAKEEYEQIQHETHGLIENREDLTMEGMTKWFDEVSAKIKSGSLIVELVPPMLYDWMDKNGNISKTGPEKWEYLNRAVNYRQSKLKEAVDNADTATNRHNLSEFMRMKAAGCFEGSEITYLKNLAKQMILFETILSQQ